MPEFVKNDALVLACYVRSSLDPTIIHGRLVLRNRLVVPSNVRPRSFVFFESDSDGGIAAANELEVDVGILVPLLNNFLDFLLLGRSATRADKRRSDRL